MADKTPAPAVTPQGMVPAPLASAPIVRPATDIQYIAPGFKANPTAPGMAEVLRWFGQQGNPQMDMKNPPTQPLNDGMGLPLLMPRMHLGGGMANYPALQPSLTPGELPAPRQLRPIAFL
jgi:hypothetical protein